jgi:hypothetical protein
MPVDPSGVTSDDHGPDGGGAAQRSSRAPTPSDARAADAAAGLPPVAGAVRSSGNGSNNGHDRAADAAADAGTPEAEAPAGPGYRESDRGDSGDRGPGHGEPGHRESDRGDSGNPAESGTVENVGLTDAEVAAAEALSAASASRAATLTEGPALGPDVGPNGDEPSGVVTGGAGVRPGGAAVLRGRARRARNRKARRGLRVRQRLWSLDPWSVFKLSALFYICVCLILLVAGTLLWNVGRSVGTIDQVEGFVTRMGAYGTCTLRAEVPAGTPFEDDDDCEEGEVLVGGYKFDDSTLFRSAAIGGGILVVAGSIGNVLMVVLLNLLNELTGGLRYTIVKEPIPRPPGGRPRGPRPAGARAMAARTGGPRHAASRQMAAPPPEVLGDSGEPIRVPAAEGSTNPGPQR